jgi:hypothetical protein
MKVEFVLAAEHELDDAISYFEAQRTGLGLEFAAEVALAVARIVRAAACSGDSNTGWSIACAATPPRSTPSCT